MKRAQELRVDEFSVQKSTESRGTIQKLTSQIQELQERVNCRNDSRESQGIESNYCAKICHVQSTSSDSKFSFSAEPRQTLAN